MVFRSTSILFATIKIIFLSLQRRRIVGNWRQTDERIDNALGRQFVCLISAKLAFELAEIFDRESQTFYMS